MAQSNNILRPLPQRAWQITPAPSDPPSPASPNPEAQEEAKQEKLSPSRTRSVLNLTSSTLFGIYSPGGPEGGAQELSQVNTPWGTGAMTPASPGTPGPPWARDKLSPTIGLSEGSRSRPAPHSPRRPLLTGTIIPLAFRSSLLFLSGLAYGLMVSYLNDNETLLPVRLEIIHQHTWQYMVFWGLSGVAMGNMLPWFDVLFEDSTSAADRALDQQKPGINRAEMERRRESVASRRESVVESVDEDGLAVWFPAVRGIGVFIGIGFAIRKLPWESTLQAILTLVLVNPVLWYIIDRSQPGFIVSVLASFAGTLLFMVVDSMLVPLSAGPISTDILQSDSLIASEVVGVFLWVASVIFCSCVCFRNIGKMLAFQSEGH